MNDEQAFINQILAEPDNDANRLIYADWLDEHGDARGEFLRAVCALQRLSPTDEQYAQERTRLQKIGETIDAQWVAMVGRCHIENCEFKFEFACPKKWEQLTPTKDAAIRFCEACRMEVYYCESVAVARLHVAIGNCVAVDCRIPRSEGDLAAGGEVFRTVGLPVYDQPSRISIAEELRQAGHRPRRRTK
jgi:uncharacterized protein (TIGR02996 family)